MLRCLPFALCLLVLTSRFLVAQQLGDDANPVDHSSAYDKVVLADQPDVWWSFDDAAPLKPFVKTGLLDVRVEGGVSLKQPGPGSAASVLFSSENRGLEFNGKKSVIKVTDPGSKSVLDFDKGEALTLEAWVKIKSISDGRYVYVVGKGRTNNKGVAAGNQSYALRLEGRGGKASVSFLFRNREDAAPASGDFHRWTTTTGFLPDSQWHHVAVSYRFGTKDSVRGYIDGRELTGEWDLKGATDKAPVVDDDELWIGSSMGVSEASTFEGSLDEVAIYRKALPLERMQARVIRRPTAEQPPLPELSSPRDEVLVEVIEGLADKPSWDTAFNEPSDAYFEPAFAFFDLPSMYSDKGIRVDRSSPLALRARCRLTYPAGKYRLLVRTLRFGRLFIDGNLVVATPVRNHRSDGHGDLYDLASKLAPGSRPLFPGSAEEQAVVELDGAEHEFRFEIYVGGQKRRLELGETSVSIVRDDLEIGSKQLPDRREG